MFLARRRISAILLKAELDVVAFRKALKRAIARVEMTREAEFQPAENTTAYVEITDNAGDRDSTEGLQRLNPTMRSSLFGSMAGLPIVPSYDHLGLPAEEKNV